MSKYIKASDVQLGDVIDLNGKTIHKSTAPQLALVMDIATHHNGPNSDNVASFICMPITGHSRRDKLHRNNGYHIIEQAEDIVRLRLNPDSVYTMDYQTKHIQVNTDNEKDKEGFARYSSIANTKLMADIYAKAKRFQDKSQAERDMQHELAKLSGTQQSTLPKIENGKTFRLDTKKLEKLAQLQEENDGTSVDELGRPIVRKSTVKACCDRERTLLAKPPRGIKVPRGTVKDISLSDAFEVGMISAKTHKRLSDHFQTVHQVFKAIEKNPEAVKEICINTYDGSLTSTRPQSLAARFRPITEIKAANAQFMADMVSDAADKYDTVTTDYYTDGTPATDQALDA